jgi:hypothetical protein
MEAWPVTSDALRELLGIKSGTSLKCHGVAKTRSFCGNDLSGASIADIAKLVTSIVSSGSITPIVLQHLQKLSSLVLCRRRHQDQSEEKRQLWVEKLRTINTKAGSRASGPSPRPAEETGERGQSRRAPPEGGRKKPPRTGKQTTTEDSSQNIPAPEKQRQERNCHVFTPYGPSRTVYHTNHEVRDKLLRPLSDRELRQGSIYAFQFPKDHRVNGGDSEAYTKIGCTVRWSTRQAAIRRECGYMPQLICAWSMPHHARFENTIHSLLHNRRKRESAGCPTCNTKHREWFEYSSEETKKLIDLWQAWAQLRPYHSDGRLRSKWRRELNGLDLADPDCWLTFLTRATGDNS